jgi:hypothetical protein
MTMDSPASQPPFLCPFLTPPTSFTRYWLLLKVQIQYAIFFLGFVAEISEKSPERWMV